MARIYAVVTSYCDRACAHCYMSAGPSENNLAKTMCPEDFGAMLAHLPQYEPIQLILTGGEFLSLPSKRSDEYLNLVKREAQKREKYGMPALASTLATNGFWARGVLQDEGPVREHFAHFKDVGITDIIIASADKYHFAGFTRKKFRYEMQELLHMQQIGRSLGFSIDIVGALGDVFPAGRAKHLGIDVTTINSHGSCDGVCKQSLDTKFLAVEYDGRVRPCLLRDISLSGNIFKQPLDDIIATAKQQAFFSDMNREGVVGIERLCGRITDMHNLARQGDCGHCFAHITDEELREAQEDFSDTVVPDATPRTA